MSTLKVNALNNGGSAIDFPSSFKIGGNPIEQGYTSSATEPTSPSTGDLWWDSANDKLYQYLNGEFKEITYVPKGFNISDLEYDSVSYTAPSAAYLGLHINRTGTKLYLASNTNDRIDQFSLSTAFDLSTASDDSVSLTFAGAESIPRDIVFNDDGSKAYVIGQSSDLIREYNLSTDYDLSTATAGSTRSVSSETGSPYAIAIGDSGTKIYVLASGATIYQYFFSNAYAVNSINYDSKSFSASAQENDMNDIAFNPDGTKMFLIGNITKSVYSYSLSTAWDVSTASYDNISADLSSQLTSAARGLAWSADGTKFYAQHQGGVIFQYSV